MTKITLLYFASIKDVTGIEQEQMEVKETTTLDDLTELLVTRYGNKIKILLEQSLYAIDMDYITKEDEKNRVLKDKMEIAIIPPVSGG